MSWVCEDCGFNEEEVQSVYELSDKDRIINQLLGLGAIMTSSDIASYTS